ncbi:MAG: GNAT family N-acetyltransferase [Myxococcota bacterium]
MQAAGDQVAYRIAGDHDRRVVVQLLTELVDELGPAEMVERVRPMLPDDVRRALASESVRVFLAEVDGCVIGLSRADVLTEDPIFRLRTDHRCGYVDQMYVRPAHRGHGIGLELLRRCEAWFKEQRITYCLLHAAPKAARFYARHGYQPNREMYKRIE